MFILMNKFNHQDIIEIHLDLSKCVTAYLKSNKSSYAKNIYGPYYRELNYSIPHTNGYLTHSAMVADLEIFLHILVVEANRSNLDNYPRSKLQKILTDNSGKIDEYLKNTRNSIARFFFGNDYQTKNYCDMNFEKISDDKLLLLFKIFSSILPLTSISIST